MSTLIIDIETTGLPETKGFDKFYDPKDIKYYNKSRIIEIAYIICSPEGETLKETSCLIKLTDQQINNTAIHGITTEMTNQNGIPIHNALQTLQKDITENNVQKIVAHNVKFDVNIILSECHRVDNKELIKIINTKQHICTMDKGRRVMNQYKSPKLTELYYFLFKQIFKQEHRALSDCNACCKCYFKLKSLCDN